MEGRPILPREEIARRINNIEVGDQFAFNDRGEPFIATGTGVTKSGKGGEITGVEAKSPEGKTWIFSEDGDWAREWNRERLDWFQKYDYKD